MVYGDVKKEQESYLGIAADKFEVFTMYMSTAKAVAKCVLDGEAVAKTGELCLISHV